MTRYYNELYTENPKIYLILNISIKPFFHFTPTILSASFPFTTYLHANALNLFTQPLPLPPYKIYIHHFTTIFTFPTIVTALVIQQH